MYHTQLPSLRVNNITIIKEIIMKKSIIFSLVTASTLMASNLAVVSASVKAHTKVFGDSTIDPMTTSLTSRLSMKAGIESIRGTVDVSVRLLKSDNENRDEHMTEAIESNKYPLATYTFKEVKKEGSEYKISGVLNFHGVKKPLNITADISEKDGKVLFKDKGSFKMSAYGVKPPKLLLLTVRDQVDLDINVKFKKR